MLHITNKTFAFVSVLIATLVIFAIATPAAADEATMIVLSAPAVANESESELAPPADEEGRTATLTFLDKPQLGALANTSFITDAWKIQKDENGDEYIAFREAVSPTFGFHPAKGETENWVASGLFTADSYNAVMHDSVQLTKLAHVEEYAPRHQAPYRQVTETYSESLTSATGITMTGNTLFGAHPQTVQFTHIPASGTEVFIEAPAGKECHYNGFIGSRNLVAGTKEQVYSAANIVITNGECLLTTTGSDLQLEVLHVSFASVP